MQGISNWVSNNNGTVTEADLKALARAKRIDARKEKNGHRWININDRIKVLVECDKNGKPTEKGMRTITLHKKLQGIR